MVPNGVIILPFECAACVTSDFGVRALFVFDSAPSFRLTLPSLYSGWHSDARVWSGAAYRGAGAGTWCCPTGRDPVVQNKGLKNAPTPDFPCLKLCQCLFTCLDWWFREGNLKCYTGFSFAFILFFYVEIILRFYLTETCDRPTHWQRTVYKVSIRWMTQLEHASENPACVFTDSRLPAAFMVSSSERKGTDSGKGDWKIWNPHRSCQWYFVRNDMGNYHETSLMFGRR
jgi:hypothetical protein